MRPAKPVGTDGRSTPVSVGHARPRQGQASDRVWHGPSRPLDVRGVRLKWKRRAVWCSRGGSGRGLGGPASRGGPAARGRRDLLLPALHAVQARVGWISQPALNEICRRLTTPPAEAYGAASLSALFSLAH